MRPDATIISSIQFPRSITTRWPASSIVPPTKNRSSRKTEPSTKKPRTSRTIKIRTRKTKTRRKKARARRNSIHAIMDAAEIKNSHVHVRGNANNLADEVPRRFLSILSPDKPLPFQQGSGRLELARAIASRDNPLTARVFVNRVWMHHFGRGLVSTPGNFGRLGDAPSHPELLDYLASRFMAELGPRRNCTAQSCFQARINSAASSTNAMRKSIQRTFCSGTPTVGVWKLNRRDAVLMVSGRLDLNLGGFSEPLNNPENHRRTLYASVSRHDLDPFCGCSIFPIRTSPPTGVRTRSCRCKSCLRSIVR